MSFFCVVIDSCLILLGPSPGPLAVLPGPSCLVLPAPPAPPAPPGSKHIDKYLFEGGGVFFTSPNTNLHSYADIHHAVVATTTTTDFLATFAIFADFREERGEDLVMEADVVSRLGTRCEMTQRKSAHAYV